MLTASLKRISDLEDHLDLMKDEFQRIKALTDNPEILGLCDRASQSTKQKVSVIRQRDSAETELTKLKADVVKLRTALEPFARGEKLSSRDSDSAPVLLKLPFGKYHFACLGHCRLAARALEETKP